MRRFALFSVFVVALLLSLFTLESCQMDHSLTEPEWGVGELTFELHEDGDSYLVSRGGTYTGFELTIPSSYQGLPVTGIKSRAFQYCRLLKKVVIPESITVIGREAFDGCANLEEISLSTKIQTIESNAFRGTAYVNDDANWDGALLYIGDCLITVKKELVESEVVIKSGTRLIANNVFYECGSLKKVVIPEGVTIIGKSAFYDCKALASISLPESLVSIGLSAFQGCAFIEMVIPNSVQTIGESVFERCEMLEKVDLPNRLEEISGGLFNACKSLKSVVIPKTVTHISSNAFKECISLESLRIPDAVKSIERDAFYGCSQLIRNENGVHYVGNWVVDVEDGVTDVALRQGTRGILPSALESSEIESVDIPESVIFIGSGAFRNSALTEVTIPGSVTELLDSVFCKCETLETVHLPGTMTYIGDLAFKDCKSLERITLPASLKSMGFFVLGGCESLLEISIPKGVTVIPMSLFSGCTNLKNVSFSGEIMAIEKEAFYQCASLQSIELPKGLTVIGESAFAECGALRQVHFPDGLTMIGEKAFENCGSLKKVTLPDSLCSLEMNSFDAELISTIGSVKNGFRYYKNIILKIETEKQYVIRKNTTSIKDTKVLKKWMRSVKNGQELGFVVKFEGTLAEWRASPIFETLSFMTVQCSDGTYTSNITTKQE